MSLLSHEEISLLNSDSKFRNYVNSIEKALKNFESSTEWADLIASLGKLKKVLQACPKYQFIPKRISVCKRLAQCLHPALPSGVHLKALEVYTVLFQNIGTENLSKDLFLYSSGLFPLLANAALSVKPVLLGIYETYFLPLKQSLRPCLIGLILGILPGLEEGSDSYTRTFNLLKNICIAQSEANKPNYSRETSVATSLSSFDSNSSNLSSMTSIAEDKYFYTCLWSAIVSQSFVRFPAITFILENYEKKCRIKNNQQKQIVDNNSDDQLYIIGNSIDLMINGICCCLQDSNSLVQRSILDLINVCLPLNTTQITKDDKLQLIVVAIHVILRRDMSLNRRIYTWLTGTTTTKPTAPQNNQNDKNNTKDNNIIVEENYFNVHSKRLLVSAIKMLLNNKKDMSILYLLNDEQTVTSMSNHQTQSASSITSMTTSSSANTNTTLKIIKIVSNLVERQEIGQSIIDEILLDLLFYIFKEYSSLVILNNNAGVGSNFIPQTHQGHKRVQSISSFSNTNIQLSNQFSKEMNELKKATSNFLFQSFQLYFIWDFCANKFEKICRELASENRTTPGQLCELYEFILDLLKNAEMFNEIQTDHLPLMLKRIIQTLNTYCSKMTNQDLTKSILLCSKILKKIVPKVIAEAGTASNIPSATSPISIKSTSSKLQRKRSQTEFSSMKNLKRISEPLKQNQNQLANHEVKTRNISSSLTNLALNEKSDEALHRIVSECINDLISQIDSSSDQSDTADFELSENDSYVSTNIKENNGNCVINTDQNEDPNNGLIFETCVDLLKQLFHTFTTSHLFKIDDADNRINKSFEDLFHYQDSYTSNYSLQNYDIQESINEKKNSPNLMKRLANIFSISLKSDHENLSDKTETVSEITDEIDSSTIQMRPECLNYLQSFQILNKFIMKMLYFPREERKEMTESYHDFSIKSRKNLIQSFESWIKDLFVISCSAEISDTKSASTTQPNSKLFEFQSITINTILELIHLSESVNLKYKETLVDSLKKLSIISFNTPDTKINKNVCFMQTVFNVNQIELIFNDSKIGDTIARMLWSHLNNDLFNYNSQLQQFTSSNVLHSFNSTDKRAAILFCLLHETLPNNLCENIIAHNLITPISNLTNSLTHQMDSLKRFTRLWHWSREINNLSIKDEPLDNLDIFSFNLATTLTLNKSTKTFERSLLIILDILNDKKAPSAIVKLIQEWLLGLISDYNDLPRILDILLVSLLHPTSARVSIQYFVHNLLNSSVQNESFLSVAQHANEDSNANILDYESKVYAISNEGGNVKYHVNEQNKSINAINTSANNQQQLFLLTSLNSTENAPMANGASNNSGNGSSSVTKSLRNPNVELPLSILNAGSLNQGISLRINPLTAKQTNQSSNSKNTSALSEYVNELHFNKNNEDETTTDDENSNEKNANFLEKYKQIKKTQLEKESTKPGELKSPSNSMPSPKKSSVLEDLAEKLATTPIENGDTFDNDYFQEFTNNHDEHDDDHESDEDYEDDEDDFISDYNDESAYDFNQFSLNNHQNTSNEDNRSQMTEITLLKDSNLKTGSSSSIDNTDTDSRSLKKSKRKSDLIISNTKSDQIDNQHQKSLSLSNQRTKKGTKPHLNSSSLFKRDLSAPYGQSQSEAHSEAEKILKTQSLKADMKLKKETKIVHSKAHNKPKGDTRQVQIKPVIQSKEHVVDALGSIDPNYSYVLLYKNCNNMQATVKDQIGNGNLQVKSSNSSYDHVRTIFILRCIEQIFIKCSKEFLTAITYNHLTKSSSRSSNSSFSVHNEKLLDLIVRHLKSIYGNNFYSSTTAGSDSNSVTNDLNFNLNNVTYIEAIILILLFYIRSYYPPSRFMLMTNSFGNQIKESTSGFSINTNGTSSSTNTSQCSTSSADTSSENTSTLSNSSHNENEAYLDHDEKLFNENRNVQIYCLQILSNMIKELTSLCKNSNSPQVNNQGVYSTYISNQHTFFQPIIDLLDRCKLQKTLLHCFYSTIHTPYAKSLAQCILSNTRPQNSSSFSSQNDVNYELANCRKQIQYSYMSELMGALENLIQLERILNDYQILGKIYRGTSQIGINSLNSQQVRALPIVTSSAFSTGDNKSNQPEDDLLLTLNKKLAAVQNNIKTKLSNASGSSIGNPQSMAQFSYLANVNQTNITSRYISMQSICNQSMFISCTLHYLKNINLVDYHLRILTLIRNSLPSAGNALKPLSTFVSEQLCRNLLQITNGGSTNSSSSSGANYLVPTIAYMSAISSSINIPDLIISILKQLSYILHYCLLNSSFSYSNMNLLYSNEFSTSPSLFGQFMPSSSGSSLTETQVKLLKQFQNENDTYQSQAKDSLLNSLPSILSHMTQVWQRCNILLNSNAAVNIMFDQQQPQQQQQQQHQYSWILGHPVLIKQCITDMLNPIAQCHSMSFMTAIGTVWGEKRKRSRLNQEHKVIIELVRSLKSFPVSTILQNITDILKQSSQSKNKEKKRNPSNVWLLQFLHSYLDCHSSLVRSKADPSVLNIDFSSNLCNFFKECMLSSTTANLAPACYFQLFRILHDSVNNFPALVDDSKEKKYTKDIQDSTHKLFELCNSIVASSLQQTTWLRKYYTVKLNSNNMVGMQPSSGAPGPTSDTNVTNGINPAANSTNKSIFGQKSDAENEMTSGLSDAATNCIDQLNSNGDMNDTTSNLSHSLQALTILAEYLAKTLDIVYKSDEKDRLVVPLLTSLMSNLWPYLKTHAVANKNNFRAASHLLMSLTVYPYTRKTWKKEVFEMLFDNLYFHLDSPTLDYSKVIIDNLISNDRSMFKDVLIRVTYQQSSGLFTSKEQESEQKAQLLKRLAFVIYSSEKDQYQKNMPEIQECIAHVLKLVQSPHLYSTLFLLFRILLLRISSRHLIALWPTMLSELIIILLQMEQDLSDDVETKLIKKWSNHSKNSYLDHIATANNQLLQSTSVKLQIYLSACKLLDLILTLPSSVTNQFQLYKWSFINTADALNLKQRDQFVPYLLKINNLLKNKFPNIKTSIYKTNGGPLIRYKQIQSLSDLKQFFDIVTSHAFVHNTTQSQASQQNFQSFPATQNTQFVQRQFESTVHEDFLEGWIQ